jgi:hypothetical protein
LVVAFFSAAGLLLALLPGLLILRRRHLRHGESWLWALLALLLLVYAAYNYWRDPGFMKYWLVPVFALWLLIALALAQVEATLKRLYRPLMSGTVAFVLLSFLLNFATAFYPVSRSEDNPWLQIATTLRAETADNALFISDSHPLDYYMMYFGQRNQISADLAQWSAGGQTDAYVLFLVQRHIAQHRQDSGTVYIYSGRDVAALATRLEIAPEKLVVAWEFPTLTIYRVDWERERRLA